MMEQRKISIIVPAYNVAQWLPRCLDSILAQTHQNLEIIVVDDGSADDTFAVMEDYAKKDSRICAIHKENGGVTSARLAGLKVATGEWIGFVDGDDAIDEDMYQHLLENALKYHADISHCGYRMVFPDGRVNYFHNTKQCIQQDKKRGIEDLLQGIIVEPGLWNKLYRRELINQMLKQSDILTGIRINEDLLMNFLLFSNAKQSVFHDFCPYQYIVREGSASRQELNHCRIYDPVTVKERICSRSTPDVADCAKGAYLSTCVNVYNSIILSHRDDLETDRKHIRQYILSHYEWHSLLGKKQKFSVGIIRFAPCMYRLLYRFYAKYFQKNMYQ